MSFFFRTRTAILLTCMLLMSVHSWANSDRKANYVPCKSSDEFIKTVDFLKKQTEFAISDLEIVKTALAISENCNGAFDRFKKMMLTLIKTGVILDNGLKFAISYSKQSDESVDAFVSLYEGLVLEGKFNLPFYKAFETARAFAESTESKNKKLLKQDFLSFLKFCTGEDGGSELPLEQCRLLAFDYLKLQAAFEKSVYEEFKALFKFLRDNRQTGLPVSVVVVTTQKVLINGPGSRNNFVDAYMYGLNKLDMKPEQAVKLGLKMASLSKPKVIDEKTTN